MEQSILRTIKPLVDVEPDDTNFDVELIADINDALATLYQLGIGPEGGMAITGNTETWDMLYRGKHLNSVITYVHLQTQLTFDPPASSSVLSSIERRLDRLEWRLNVAAESKEGGGRHDSGAC